ncbi:DUF3622 domain-containing protein [Thalassotalea fonticola]|uniref:DUF3622 domain-containing protein n=1 Tax=Thalassotalea fonticola TaxID=3065649 RepID=A0ABZ0GTC6_9GAMM|nr:DUF3622 domain-containing protein [Colwelliaceae bacterium S1-1]
MSKAPKYTFRVVEKRNSTWTAEIQRQATSKKKVVSKRQTGFASEAEGVVWAENELKQVLANHVARNKRHDEDRAEQYKDKLKKAELAAAKAALANEETADSENTEESEQSFTLSDVEQEKAISDLQELEQLESDDSEQELSDKPARLKFDFELDLEEAELAEEEAKNKAKAKSKTKADKQDSAEGTDEAETADGAEVNSIYLQNK